MQFRSIAFRSIAATCLVSSAALMVGWGNSEAAPAVNNSTAVLVHGAWADGSSWSRVAGLLQQRGVHVVSVQLQRKSLAEDAAIVRRAIAAQTGPVVLAGHSYGGAVISEAGNESKVSALVYVAAFAPGDGESITDLIKPYPAGAWHAGLVADSAGYLTLDTTTFQTYFAPDLPKQESALLAAGQAPISHHVLDDKVTRAAWKMKPSYWVVSGNDKIIPPAFQQSEAARINAKVTTIEGASHVELLSHPKEVTAVILDAMAAVR